jgi:hypothetical protein
MTLAQPPVRWSVAIINKSAQDQGGQGRLITTRAAAGSNDARHLVAACCCFLLLARPPASPQMSVRPRRWPASCYPLPCDPATCHPASPAARIHRRRRSAERNESKSAECTPLEPWPGEPTPALALALTCTYLHLLALFHLLCATILTAQPSPRAAATRYTLHVSRQPPHAHALAHASPYQRSLLLPPQLLLCPSCPQ